MAVATGCPPGKRLNNHICCHTNCGFCPQAFGQGNSAPSPVQSQLAGCSPQGWPLSGQIYHKISPALRSHSSKALLRILLPYRRKEYVLGGEIVPFRSGVPAKIFLCHNRRKKQTKKKNAEVICLLGFLNKFY